MKAVFSVGASRDLRNLGQQLQREMAPLPGEHWHLAVQIKATSLGQQLICLLDDGEGCEPAEEIVMILRQFLTRLLVDWIMTEWQRLLIVEELAQYRGFFEGDEEDEAVARACQALEQGEKTSKNYLFYRMGYRQQMIEMIGAILQEQHQVDVDGFLRFRMQEYRMAITDAVLMAVDDLAMEKEYRDFVGLLQFFLEGQDYRIPQAHVYLDGTGHFELLDRQGASLLGEEWTATSMRIDEHVGNEDVLISTLVTLAPQEVIVHFIDGYRTNEAITTLQAVFGERLHYCTGCDRCRASVQQGER
ncbi:putative sporulation protein YtxC [Heliophilum fasciatum]|uniref:putative sporulation protein YtxC n=1 Tax=Heliophilum fasciatum TaxID=35700 RepID=UPI001044B10B|nr:putative sporulation protein YtxC [Heliophilum fasciatum]MCW2276747.1 putative sporulation protein YtxC [Heliophilum fasciatum]